MTSIELLLIILISVMIVILIIILFYLLNNKNNKYDETRLAIKDDLNDLSNKVDNELDQLFKQTSDSLLNLQANINRDLSNNNKETNILYTNINERLARIDVHQQQLNEFSKDLSSLKFIFNDKKSRGTFGEVELYSILENTFGNDERFFKKQVLLSNGTRADVAINGNEDIGLICIDSKFPLENFNKLYLEEEQGNREKNKNAFKNDVIKHLKTISDKYIIPGETADLAYMFVPAEAVFAEIYGHYPEIIDLSYQLKVYIVSPSTLMAYITSLKSIYLGRLKNEKAKEIEILLNDLANDFQKFKERSDALQKDYEKIGNDFHLLNITSNKLIKRFSKLEHGNIDSISNDID